MTTRPEKESRRHDRHEKKQFPMDGGRWGGEPEHDSRDENGVQCVLPRVSRHQGSNWNREQGVVMLRLTNPQPQTN